MKTRFGLIIIFALLFGSNLFAQSVHFKYIHDGEVFNITYPQTQIGVNIEAWFTPHNPGSGYYLPELNYYLNGNSCGSSVNVGIGTSNVKAVLTELNTLGQRVVTAYDEANITVAYSPTHGNCWAYVSSTTYPGGVDDKTSSYVSPGSTVTYSLQVGSFRMQGPTIYCYAYIWGAGTPNSFDVWAQVSNDSYYEEIDQSKSGSFTSSGGFIELHAIVDIHQGFQGGGQASAYISW